MFKSINETKFLLKSPAMKRRLLEAKKRKTGLSLEQVLTKLHLKIEINNPKSKI